MRYSNYTSERLWAAMRDVAWQADEGRLSALEDIGCVVEAIGRIRERMPELLEPLPEVECRCCHREAPRYGETECPRCSAQLPGAGDE